MIFDEINTTDDEINNILDQNYNYTIRKEIDIKEYESKNDSKLLSFNITNIPLFIYDFKNEILISRYYEILEGYKKKKIDKLIECSFVIIANLWHVFINNKLLRISNNINSYNQKSTFKQFKQFNSLKLVKKSIKILQSMMLITQESYSFHKTKVRLQEEKSIPNSKKVNQKLKRFSPNGILLLIFNKHIIDFKWKLPENRIKILYHSRSSDKILMLKDKSKQVKLDILHNSITFPKKISFAQKKKYIYELREQLKIINKYYKEQELILTSLYKNYDFVLINRGKEEGFIDHISKNKWLLKKINLIRIFNNNDFTQGGRCYCYFQQFSKESRKKLLINQEPVSLVDICGSHMNILRALNNVPGYSKDPYLTLYDNNKHNYNDYLHIRKTNKLILLILLNANSISDVYRLTTKYLRNKYKNYYNDYNFICKIVTSEDVKYWVDSVINEHIDIKKYFCSGIGIKLQYYESIIILNTIINLLQNYNIPVYPVHDELICPKKYANFVSSIMNIEYKKILGQDLYVTID